MHRPIALLQFENPLHGLIFAAVFAVVLIIVLLYEHLKKSKNKCELDKTQLKGKLFLLSNRVSIKKTDAEMAVILREAKQALQAYKRYHKRQFWRNVREIYKEALNGCPGPHSTNTLTALRLEAQGSNKGDANTYKASCRNKGDCSTCFRRIRLFF